MSQEMLGEAKPLVPTAGLAVLLATLGPFEAQDVWSAILKDECLVGDDAPDAVGWRTLAGVCSYMLHPDKAHAPFGPMMVMSGQRSAMPEDLSESDLAQLESLLATCVQPELEARIADVLWLRRRDRRFADHAVRAYIEAAELRRNDENWHDCAERAERGYRLARLLRGAPEPLALARAYLVKLITVEGDHAADCLARRAIELLVAHDDVDGLAIADRISHGIAATRDGDRWAERDWIRLRQALASRQKDEAARITATLELAEAWIRQADAESRSDGGMAEPFALQEAIAILRNVKGQTAQVAELSARLAFANQRAATSFARIEASVDISEIAKQVEQQVRGKPLADALRWLAVQLPLAGRAALEDACCKQAAAAPLSAMLGATKQGVDGRVLSIRPHANPGDGTVDDTRLMEALMHQQQFAVGAVLAPALSAIADEHYVSVSNLLAALGPSFCIEPGRIESFGKGMTSGLSFNFLEAAYLLTPFVEHFVRRLARTRGMDVLISKADGSQELVSLDGLLKRPGVRDVLGESLCLHLRCLLTDGDGVNLRNELMHGNWDDGHAFGWPSALLWWTTLHLAFRFQYRVSSADEASGPQ